MILPVYSSSLCRDTGKGQQLTTTCLILVSGRAPSRARAAVSGSDYISSGWIYFSPSIRFISSHYMTPSFLKAEQNLVDKGRQLHANFIENKTIKSEWNYNNRQPDLIKYATSSRVATIPPSALHAQQRENLAKNKWVLIWIKEIQMKWKIE